MARHRWPSRRRDELSANRSELLGRRRDRADVELARRDALATLARKPLTIGVGYEPRPSSKPYIRNRTTYPWTQSWFKGAPQDSGEE